MPVSTKHKDYSRHAERATLVSDCYDGLDAETGKAYVIRRPSEKQQYTGDEVDLFSRRVSRGIFTNYVARTIQGLAGGVFRESPVIDLPESSQHLLQDADSGLTPLDQVIKRAFFSQMKAGFCGVLADYPQTDPSNPPSAEEMQRRRIASYLSFWEFKSIINYRVGNVNGRRGLTLLVLLEIVKSYDQDRFQGTDKKQYRVLEMVDGAYQVSLYDEEEKPIAGSLTTPRNHSGERFDHIPFYFLGARDNFPGYDPTPLYDIAQVNVGHYRNSVDEETNLSIHAGATVVIKTNMDGDDFKKANPQGLQVGDNSGVLVGEGGDAKLLQLEPAQAISEAMEKKEARIVQLGAKIIHKTGGTETAEAARIRATGEYSMLDTSVENLEDGFTKVLQDCALFDGGDPEQVKVKLNRKYWWEKLDPQEVMALIQLNDVGALRKERLVRLLQESGIEDAEETVEDILEKISQESPI